MQAVGYIRISTNMKRQDDQALEKQATKIREACLGAELNLTGIFEDVASASSKDSLKRRVGLQDALGIAQAQNGTIVVTEPSRLFRHPDEARKVSAAYPSIKVWSVKHRSYLTQDELLNEVVAAAAQAEAFRIGTSEAQISRGFTGPDHEAKLLGSRQSLQSRKAQAAARIGQLATILEEFEQSHPLTSAKAAELFNSRMLRTSQYQEWTKINVRRDLKAARKLIQERKEISDLTDHLIRSP